MITKQNKTKNHHHIEKVFETKGILSDQQDFLQNRPHQTQFTRHLPVQYTMMQTVLWDQGNRLALELQLGVYPITVEELPKSWQGLFLWKPPPISLIWEFLATLQSSKKVTLQSKKHMMLLVTSFWPNSICTPLQNDYGTISTHPYSILHQSFPIVIPRVTSYMTSCTATCTFDELPLISIDEELYGCHSPLVEL